jgi:secreted trypsin-like serine protease
MSGARLVNDARRACAAAFRRTSGRHRPLPFGLMRALVTTALTLVAAASVQAGAQAATSPRAHVGIEVRQRQRSYQLHRKSVARAAIIGGTDAENGAFPWLAYFTDRVEVGSGEEGGTCSGTVVAANLVLTAAHCVEDPVTGVFYKGSGYLVVTGTVEPSSSKGQASSVSRVIVYPGFDRSTGTGDAALLVLSTLTTVPPITLASSPSGSAMLRAGTEAFIVGWGRTSYKNPANAKALRWANTFVQSSEWCGLNASPFDSQAQLCVNGHSYSTSICYGDSGGPLLAEVPSRTEEVEIGVASRDEGAECSPQSASVFTRADVIASWVNESIQALKPVPPNEPGYYVTRPSKTRKVVIHVSGDGAHIVGLRIKVPLICQHGYEVPSIEESWLTHAKAVAIVNHAARATLNTQAEGIYKSGHIHLDLWFTATGIVKGLLNVDIPTRNKRLGACTNTLKFTATT